jgi:hypothetical protein
MLTHGRTAHTWIDRRQVAIVANGEYKESIPFLMDPSNFELQKQIAMFTVVSALGQNFIFMTLENFDALILTTVTTTRKCFTVAVSIMCVAPHPHSHPHTLTYTYTRASLLPYNYLRSLNDHDNDGGNQHITITTNTTTTTPSSTTATRGTIIHTNHHHFLASHYVSHISSYTIRLNGCNRRQLSTNRCVGLGLATTSFSRSLASLASSSLARHD